MNKLTLLLILLIFCGAVLLSVPCQAGGKADLAKPVLMVKGKASGSTAAIKQVREASKFSLFQAVKGFIVTRWHIDTIIKDQQYHPDQPQKGYGPAWHQEYLVVRDNGWVEDIK